MVTLTALVKLYPDPYKKDADVHATDLGRKTSSFAALQVITLSIIQGNSTKLIKYMAFYLFKFISTSLH